MGRPDLTSTLGSVGTSEACGPIFVEKGRRPAAPLPLTVVLVHSCTARIHLAFTLLGVLLTGHGEMPCGFMILAGVG